VLAVFAMMLLWLGGIGAVTPETLRLFIFWLPAVLVGTWLGFRLNGKRNEAVFRIMLLLWASGARFAVSNCCGAKIVDNQRLRAEPPQHHELALHLRAC
jgi:uncharacterized membrane protein YfcA